MGDILQEIVSAKRQEIARRQAAVPASVLESRLGDAPPVRDFRSALEKAPYPSIIAEIKKASPSAGVFRPDFDPVAIARIYDDNGASAISVLTDEQFFQGSLEHLRAVRRAVGLPLLRKDFILDGYQVLEARLAGAEAVLLIAEVLDGEALPRLLSEIHSHGMQALVELYDKKNLPRMLDAGATIVGINNRNLRTFETRLEHTLELAAAVPAHVCLVSESGIRSRADMEKLRDAGVKAVLIGETLMRAPDIGAKVTELRGLRERET